MFGHKVKYLNVIVLIWLDFKFSSEPTFSSQTYQSRGLLRMQILIFFLYLQIYRFYVT